ncbi:MAG: glycosyltransferase family 4 protein [Patescibacteria group bacterium]
MKILVLTQKMDRDDPGLGFFHDWIEKFASRFEFITVICLYKGKCELPTNVKVLSLGKEGGESHIKYLYRFYKYIWRERKNYDAVFVHMNQEYVILGWKVWWILRKPIYMWRNHHAGSVLTDLASVFCTKVFCTSKFSYTAKYKKTILMPIGVDTEVFGRQYSVDRKKNSILFLARIAPVKKPDLLVEALNSISDKDYRATVLGDALPKDSPYYEIIKAKANPKIVFEKGIPNSETPAIYAAHEIFVNLSSSGMYDKTIIEAMAAGCLVLASNENLRGQISDDFVFREGDRSELALKLKQLLSYSAVQKENARMSLKEFASMHSLSALTEKLYKEISK